MNITIVGAGYVGLPFAAVLADFGHKVWIIRRNEEKNEALKKGKIDFFEPGLERLVRKNLKAGRFLPTTDYSQAIPEVDVIFIAVGTPSAADGAADLSQVFEAAKTIGRNLKKGYTVVVDKSTVPPGTAAKVSQIIKKHKQPQAKFDICSCPEFLREGFAVEDTFHPDRVIIGSESPKAIRILKQLHQDFKAPILVTNIISAEMVKYAANAYLALRITFANQVADFCEKAGADVEEIIKGIGLDKRIGSHYWYPGLGYGGSCFSSDSTLFILDEGNPKIVSFEELFSQIREKETKGELQIAYSQKISLLGFDLKNRKVVFAPLYCLTKRKYTGIMIKIKTRMGRAVEVTPDHPLVIWDKKEKEFRTIFAEEVKEEHCLVTFLDFPKIKTESSINLVSWMEKENYKEKTLIRPEKNYKYFGENYDTKIKSHIDHTYLKYPYDIKRKNYLPFDFYLYLKKRGVIAPDESKLRVFNTTTYCPAVFPINRDFVRFLGYYLAEGWISQDYGRNNVLRKRIGLTFGSHENEYIEDVARILESLKIKYMIKQDGASFSFIISSKPFAFLIEDIFKCGRNSYDKKLPSFIFGCRPSLKKEVLRGLFSGDGSLSFVFNQYPCLEFATVSRKLAEGVIFLLQSLDIIPSLKVQKMNKSTREAYIIRVGKKRQLLALKDVLGRKKSILIEKALSGYKREILSPGYRSFSQFAILPVSQIKKKKVKNIEVYSGETESKTLITSFGLLAHNCFPKDVAALAAFGKKLREKDSLFEKMDKFNHSRVAKIITKLEKKSGSFKGKTIGILGLACKKGTDDVRNSPAIDVIEILKKKRAKLKAYDPLALAKAKEILTGVAYSSDPYQIVKNADALLVLNDCLEFAKLDYGKIKKLMRGKFIFDSRNLLNKEKLISLGFNYQGVGR